MTHRVAIVAVHGPVTVTERGRDVHGHFVSAEKSVVLMAGEAHTIDVHGGNAFVIEDLPEGASIDLAKA